jgi:hypothetical protein
VQQQQQQGAAKEMEQQQAAVEVLLAKVAKQVQQLQQPATLLNAASCWTVC